MELRQISRLAPNLQRGVEERGGGVLPRSWGAERKALLGVSELLAGIVHTEDWPAPLRADTAACRSLYVLGVLLRGVASGGSSATRLGVN